MKRSKLVEPRTRISGRESAYISGTRTRVSTVARMYDLLHEEAMIERIQQELPHLTRSQIAAALDYWRENKQQIAAEIADDEKFLAEPSAAK